MHLIFDCETDLVLNLGFTNSFVYILKKDNASKISSIENLNQLSKLFLSAAIFKSFVLARESIQPKPSFDGFNILQIFPCSFVKYLDKSVSISRLLFLASTNFMREGEGGKSELSTQ